MMTTPKTVLLLAGGRSSERDVSLASGEAVREGLIEIGHDVIAVEIAKHGRWHRVEHFKAGPGSYGEPVSVTPGEPVLGADLAFPVLHGPFGEDGTIQGLFETIGMPYVGAGVAASAVCMDKLLFKEVAGRAGIPQVDYRAVSAGDWEADEARQERLLQSCGELAFPLFVKPARLGSSVGISRVDDRADLRAAIEVALEYDPRVIVEAAAAGDEIECAITGNDAIDVSQPGKLEFDADWYDFGAKYDSGSMRLIAPAPMSQSLEIEICSLAARVYRLMGCTGMARADFFVEGDKILVNELNTIPGFTPTSVFAKLYEASGLQYGELLGRLLELAIERFDRERVFKY